LSGFLSEEHIDLLGQISRGPSALQMASGNAKLAKDYRESVKALYNSVSGGGENNAPSPSISKAIKHPRP